MISPSTCELDTKMILKSVFSDVTKIQNGIGDKVGMLIHSLAMFLASYVIGFVYSWKLTLVIMAVSPLMIITTAITGKVSPSLPWGLTAWEILNSFVYIRCLLHEKFNLFCQVSTS